MAPENPKDSSVEDLLKRLKEPAPIVIAERFKFYQKSQGPEESVAQFTAELRKLAIHCNFGTHLEDALRDRLVCGLKPALQGEQKKLLGMKELKLKKALAEALSHEAIEGKSKEMCDQQLPLPPAPIEKVSDHPKSTRSGQQKGGLVFVVGEKGICPSHVDSKSLNIVDVARKAT